jgi:hypothetical protein
MAENTGLAEPGRVSGGERETVLVNDRKVTTRHWAIESDHVHSNVWFDDRGVAVRFDALVDGRTILFALESEKLD